MLLDIVYISIFVRYFLNEIGLLPKIPQSTHQVKLFLFLLPKILGKRFCVLLDEKFRLIRNVYLLCYLKYEKRGIIFFQFLLLALIESINQYVSDICNNNGYLGKTAVISAFHCRENVFLLLRDIKSYSFAIK